MYCLIFLLLAPVAITSPMVYLSAAYQDGWIMNQSPVILNIISTPTGNAISPYHNVAQINDVITV
jgi:hypothetical protein